jgi:uncharacterized membrane-anchored protein YhcB (DUF1043 family)
LCNAHSLHNAIHHALSLETISGLLKRARAIVGHFKHSSKQEAKLKKQLEELQLPVLKLQQEVVTRWNSTFNMIDSLIKNQEAIDNVLKEKTPDLVLTKSEWKFLSAFQEVLTHPAKITKQMSGSNYPTVSIIWPMFCTLVTKLDGVKGTAREFADKIAAGVRQRTGNLCAISVELLASCLDPRFKALNFVKVDVRKAAHKTILKLLKNAPEAIETTTKKRKIDEDQYALYGLEAPAELSAVELEWKMFLNEEDASPMTDCLTWWTANRSRYPRVATLARKYLCIPATSVPSEQLFSHAGDTITKKRNSLKPENAELLVFVGDNYKYYYDV